MPMIDVYAADGTFDDKHALAKDLAAAVMRWEQVPNLALFRNNTAAFIHELPADSLSNVVGDTNYVRVQVLTPVGVLDRNKQLGVVKELTDIVAAAAGDPTLSAPDSITFRTRSPISGYDVPSGTRSICRSRSTCRHSYPKFALRPPPTLLFPSPACAGPSAHASGALVPGERLRRSEGQGGGFGTGSRTSPITHRPSRVSTPAVAMKTAE